MNLFRKFFTLLFCLSLVTGSYHASMAYSFQTADTSKIDREYTLEATMLGYMGADGTRNPTLRANKGEKVRINIVNGEVMTHDIALEKLGIKSKGLVEKGSKASITFRAINSDTYYCTVPGHRAAGMVGRFDIVEGPITNTPSVKGILPQKNGKPLNLNFETGTLKDWTATGTAFAEPTKPIISEDPSPVHGKDMHIGFAGKYFVTSGGTKNYKQTGTLTSVPFKVTQPFAAFRVSGGALVDTRVEIVRADNDSVFFHITGQGRATLQPVVVDLTPIMGKEIYIRLIDKETGISQIPYIGDDIWGHISFDDFLFYPSRPDFTNELLKKDIIILPPLDVVKFAGLSGIEAAKAMTVPQGFKVTLAASEPQIIRPIAFTIDWKGRLWVGDA
ncbi:MAG: hypothetical protein EOP54_19085 [Sphingobacteriales bacterium]|nr:MAG: hypothetical protein EOP54_19085 [Sphingobacteriales bacterium]